MHAERCWPRRSIRGACGRWSGRGKHWNDPALGCAPACCHSPGIGHVAIRQPDQSRDMRRPPPLPAAAMPPTHGTRHRSHQSQMNPPWHRGLELKRCQYSASPPPELPIAWAYSHSTTGRPGFFSAKVSICARRAYIGHRRSVAGVEEPPPS